MPNGWVLNQARCLPLNWFIPTKIALDKMMGYLFEILKLNKKIKQKSHLKK